MTAGPAAIVEDDVHLRPGIVARVVGRMVEAYFYAAPQLASPT
ncbi:MAG: hypothetical protein QNJ13_14585 [Paracoccaceae bacterium]|nr:hypothetical protein [Paracoccaceae bacterium]